jgi:hypothetical protein
MGKQRDTAGWRSLLFGDCCTGSVFLSCQLLSYYINSRDGVVLRYHRYKTHGVDKVTWRGTMAESHALRCMTPSSIQADSWHSGTMHVIHNVIKPGDRAAALSVAQAPTIPPAHFVQDPGGSIV